MVKECKKRMMSFVVEITWLCTVFKIKECLPIIFFSSKTPCFVSRNSVEFLSAKYLSNDFPVLATKLVKGN